MRHSAIVAIVAVMLVRSGLSLPGTPEAPCSTAPEAQGLDSAVLSGGLLALKQQATRLQSLLVAKNGCLIVEGYRPPFARERRHYLNSATKAVLSALVGIAVDQGLLDEETRVLSLLSSERDGAGPDPRRQAITVRDLLTMSSGIAWHQGPPDNTSDDMGRSADWVRFILTRPMAAQPGTVTNYSNGDAHLLAAALQNAIHATVFDFARQRLFAPLHIDDVAWDRDPQGRSIGSAALQMRPVDMVKIGSLYLQDGRYQGQQVLRRDWVAQSLSPHGRMPAKGGPVAYGYYWWLYPERHVAEAWGGAGQRIGIMRDVNVVVVMTADDPADYPRSPLAARIYDAIRASVRSSRRLPPNPRAQRELARVVSELMTP